MFEYNMHVIVDWVADSLFKYTRFKGINVKSQLLK